MNILWMLKSLVTVEGLRVLLLDKEVTMPDGTSLGTVVSIKKELSQDKIMKAGSSSRPRRSTRVKFLNRFSYCGRPPPLLRDMKRS